MANFPFRRFRPILDLGEQLGLDPDAAVGDALAERLGCADQRRETGAERLRALGDEAVVGLAGINQIGALASADVQPVPLVAIEGDVASAGSTKPGKGALAPIAASFLRRTATAQTKRIESGNWISWYRPSCCRSQRWRSSRATSSRIYALLRSGATEPGTQLNLTQVVPKTLRHPGGWRPAGVSEEIDPILTMLLAIEQRDC
jgi:hypothetical protein